MASTSSRRRSTRLSVNKRRPSVIEDHCDIQISENDENLSVNVQFRTPSRRKLIPKKFNDGSLELSNPTLVRLCESEDEDEKHISPPKQQKFQTKSTTECVLSPSRLIDRLSIEDHDGDSETDKKLEKEVKKNKYQNARRVLNSAETNILPGRESEIVDLEEYLTDHLENEKSGSLYVSGQPGTGKTACLSYILKSEKFTSKFQKIYINCTSISTIGSVYKKICTELKLKVLGKTEKEHLNAITKYLSSKHKMILMVLDEIDQLCGHKQSVLYTIFEWPSQAKNNILLIGIANSLDLTDRMLIRLNSRCDLKPKLLHFAPYTKDQIIKIFISRLEEAGVIDIFPPVAIQLLAAKVASISGDVRRALDIGRRVVQIAEKEGNKAKLSYHDLGIESLDDKEKETPAPVKVQQVVSVLNNVYGASQTLNDDMDDSLPLQQKILLCSLILILKKGKNKDVTVGRLHDVYKRVCHKCNILGVDQTEFVGLCSLVDTRGIIRMIGKKEPRLNKIVLQWDESEVTNALKDKQLISTILDDTTCLERK